MEQMRKMKDLNILFIGNSHTYYNDMPRLVKVRADEGGCNCRVTMLAHPNWFLSQHAEEPEARFNRSEHLLRLWARTGGPIKKAGRTWKCMTRMAHMPPAQARISQPS